MKRKLIIVIATILLVIINIVHFTTSWTGKGEMPTVKNMGIDTSYLELDDSPITQAEFANRYAKEHYFKYSLYSAPKGEHWATKQMSFFEEETGILITNPEGEVNREMYLKVFPETENIKEDEQILSRSSAYFLFIENRSLRIAIIPAAMIFIGYILSRFIKDKKYIIILSSIWGIIESIAPGMTLTLSVLIFILLIKDIKFSTIESIICSATSIIIGLIGGLMTMEFAVLAIILVAAFMLLIWNWEKVTKALNSHV